MSTLIDDLRKCYGPLHDEAANEIERLDNENSELKNAYELLFKENEKFKGLNAFTRAWCSTCKTIKATSIRENSATCADLCCEECHTIIVTLYKDEK